MKKIATVSLFFLMTLTGAGAIIANAAENNVQAKIVRAHPLAENRRSPAVIRLERAEGGFPVLAEEFQKSDSMPLRLFIIDPSFSDFHMETAHPTDRPGEYIFTMTPHTGCGYRIWAANAMTGSKTFTDIHGARDCSEDAPTKTPLLEFQDSRYRFKLSFDSPSLKAGSESIARLSISRKDGGAVSAHDLEPVMGAYAHMTGFYEDFKTIVLTDPVEPDDPGNAVLSFRIKPQQNGFLKLFTTIVVEGVPVTASFGVNVREDSSAPFAADRPDGEEASVAENRTDAQTTSESGLSQEDLDFERMLEEKAFERMKEQQSKKKNPVRSLREEKR